MQVHKVMQSVAHSNCAGAGTAFVLTMMLWYRLVKILGPHRAGAWLLVKLVKILGHQYDRGL
eukprot:1219404-Karenia_brevis.AAC.1